MIKSVMLALCATLAVSLLPSNSTQAASSSAQSTPQVVMYATENCGYCARARSYFEQRGIAWQEYDIARDADAAQRFKALGGIGTPLIFVGETRIAGFDPVRIERALSP
jgi:glutaredoxin